MNLSELITTAIHASIDAGTSILEVYNSSDFGIEYKKDDSPLTKADFSSHNSILTHLTKGTISVLSEEGRSIPYDERKKWDYFWCVDPLDGTKEFIKRNGEFTVNIALIKGNSPIAGVIYVPVTGELYAGIIGEGAFKTTTTTALSWEELKTNGLQLPHTQPETFTVVGSRSHQSPETQAYFESLQNQHGTLEIISKGSSLKLCMVAEGLANEYPRFAPTMEWDTAAGHAICNAAGKKVFQHNSNQELQYNKENLLNPWFLVK